ncbi:hypothetical protein CDN97_23235 [Pantoea sp. AMG 501]|nr:hypothetical protein CDN97_23235 [Pantoea sp. AMG 501]
MSGISIHPEIAVQKFNSLLLNRKRPPGGVHSVKDPGLLNTHFRCATCISESLDFLLHPWSYIYSIRRDRARAVGDDLQQRNQFLKQVQMAISLTENVFPFLFFSSEAIGVIVFNYDSFSLLVWSCQVWSCKVSSRSVCRINLEHILISEKAYVH